MKSTVISRAIDEIFDKSKKPVTVSNIIIALRNRGITANKTTVYRQLTKLINEDRVRTVKLASKSTSYEKNQTHHHHLVCQSCDAIKDIVIANEDTFLNNLIKQQKGFIPERHELEIFGRCASCSK